MFFTSFFWDYYKKKTPPKRPRHPKDAARGGVLGLAHDDGRRNVEGAEQHADRPVDLGAEHAKQEDDASHLLKQRLVSAPHR